MAPELRLPVSVVGPSDVVRLRRELERFDDEQRQAELRAKAGASDTPSRPGRILTELAALNKGDLQTPTGRKALLDAFDTVLKIAPTITMSFASEPSAAFMAKIVGWFRSAIHPSLLVRIGLQPNIAAGCTVRTPGKVFDFSLRSKFTEQRPLLLKGSRSAAAAAPAPAPAPLAPAAPGQPEVSA